MSRRKGDAGQTSLLIIGFAAILVMIVVAVVNASAAYLQRQGLDNLADGAALYGADLGSTGIYETGLTHERLDQRAAAVEGAVRDYLRVTGAHQRYPGITARVHVDSEAQSVTVTIEAPLDLPMHLPGSPRRPVVGASGTAAVTVLD